MKKLIINTNPAVVLQDFEKAVNQGYYFVPGRSDLFVHTSGLIEVELFKQEVQIVPVEEFTDKVIVQNHDKTSFILDVQRYISSGYQIDLNSVYFDVIGIKYCKMFNPNHPAAITYTKEQLKEMEYDDLKKIAKQLDCFNKSRDMMVSNILRKQEGKQ